MKIDTKTEILSRIASETHVPLEEVERSYQEAWQALSVDARVLDYLPLFAARRVTTKLREHRQA